MKTRIILSMLFAGTALNVSAQYTGIILDPDSVPAEYVTVSLLNPGDSVFIAGGMTSKRGEFSIDCPQRKVIARASLAGYAPVYKSVEDGNVGIIRLSAAQLDEVTISVGSGGLISRKVDRLIYNVENDPFAQDKTALQLLERTPRMVVSETDGTVEMIGRNGVRVLINGRLLSEDEGKSFLKSMKAEEISSIEVIPVPPAKYHAEGDIGMINVRLRTNPGDGLQGNVTLNYNQGDKASTAPSAALNWHKGIWSVRLGLTATIFNVKQESGEAFFYSDKTFERETDTDTKLRDYSGNLMIQANPTSKLEIGAIIEGGLENNKFFEDKLSGYKETASQINTLSTSNPKNKRFNGLVYGDVALNDKGAKLTLTYNNHFRRRGIDDTFLSNVNSTENDIMSTGTYYYRTNSLMADFNIPVSSINIETGASGQMVDNTCDLGLAGDLTASMTKDRTKYRYDENIYAAYVSASAPIGSKIYAKAGLRYEHTNLGGKTKGSGNTLSQNYDNLFPTAYVSWNINNSHSLSLNYARRIDRPYFEDLNPFARYYDVNLYHAGNPDLKPSASDNMELNYSYKGNLNITLWGNLLHDKIDYIPLFSDDGTQTQDALNCVDTRKGGLTVSYNYIPAGWLMVFLQGSAYYSHSHCRLPELNIKDSDGWGGNFNIYANLFLNKRKTLIGGVSFFQMLPSAEGLTKTSGLASLGVNLSWSLLEGKLNLMFGANDIFSQSTSKARRHYAEYKYTTFTNSRQRGVWVGACWNFGKRTVNDINVNSRDVLGSRGL